MNTPDKYQEKKHMYEDTFYNYMKECKEINPSVNCIQSDYLNDIRANNRNIYNVSNTSLKEDIIIYDDILDKDTINVIYDFCKNTPMIMKHGSINKNKINIYKSSNLHKNSDLIWPNFTMNFHRFNIINNKYFNDLFYKKILPFINIKDKDKLSLDRSYVNTHIMGRSGLFHKDGKSIYERDKKDSAPTVLLYINDDWDINFDGTTGFMLNDNDIKSIYHIEFKCGRIVVMPSYVSHKMCDISTYSYRNSCLRYVIAFHLLYNQTADKY